VQPGEGALDDPPDMTEAGAVLGGAPGCASPHIVPSRIRIARDEPLHRRKRLLAADAAYA
jgi:hypothetical protein